MLRIKLLGAFQLTYHERPVTTVNTTRLQSLLAYLVLHVGEPLARQHLAFLFWPDSTESQSRTNLRKALFDLRRALPDADHFLQIDRNTVLWPEAAPYWLDVEELNGLLRSIEQEAFDRDKLISAFELYRGELLLGCYDDWVILLRDQVRRRVQSALEKLVTLLENQRHYKESIRYAQHLLDLDPLNEATYQRLMRLHALTGDRSGALRVYHDCVRLLQRELDVEPDEATQEIYSRILNRGLRPETAQTTEVMSLVDATDLVGREQEWQTLQSAWQQAIQGHAQLVAICGEAGIGKTRLAEELMLWASRQGVSTARTRSHQVQGALAYAPVAECLRSVTLHKSLDRLEDVWLVEVSRLLPDLVSQRSDLPLPEPMAESWQRLRFFEALTRAVMVDEQPLLLLFDDLQWCDQETLEWLHFFIDQSRHRALLVLATVRENELDAGHPYATLRTALNRAGQLTTLQLPPLNEEETAALAVQLEATELSESQAAGLFADTAGNPLFVVETLRARHQNGGGAVGDTAGDKVDGAAEAGLPPKVYAVIQSRLTQLSLQAREIAALAAVAGNAFSYKILREATRLDEDALVDSLDELWRRRIVVERGSAYDFSHDRLRDVAYAEISRARRRLFHHHIARALVTVHVDDLSAVYGQLAVHSVGAGEVNDAVRYYRLAGDQSHRLYALREALEHYQHALAMAEDSRTCDELLSLSAQLTLDLYQGEAAVKAYNQLVQRAEQRGKPGLALEALLGLGWAHYIIAMDQPASASVQESWDAFEQACGVARDIGDTRGMVRARVGTRYQVMFSGDYFDRAQSNINEALALSRSLGDEALELDSVMAAFHFLSPVDWEREGERLAPQSQRLADRAQWTELNFLLQVVHAVRGNFDRSVEYGNVCIDLATASGVPPVQYPSYKALALIHLGRYDEAWVSLQQEVVDETRPFGRVFNTYATAIYLLDILAYEQAASMLAEVVEQARQLHRPWLEDLATVHLGRALALGGQVDGKGLSRIAQALSEMNSTLLARIVGLPAVAQGEIALASGEPVTAIRQLGEAMLVAKTEGRRPDLAMAAEVQARIFLRLGNAERALMVAEEGLILAESMEYLPMVWRLQEIRARALQKLENAEEATRAFQICAGVVSKLAETIPDPGLRQEFLSDRRVSAAMNSHAGATEEKVRTIDAKRFPTL